MNEGDIFILKPQIKWQIKVNRAKLSKIKD